MSIGAPGRPDAAALERCMAVGGLAVFPSDTVYGLACDPANRLAVQRLYALKRRPLDKPSAIMFFSLDLALAALPELGERTREALGRLMPGGVSVLLPNPAGRFPLACGADPDTLGLRVVSLPGFSGVRWPVLQSSANLAGGPEAVELRDVPEVLRRAADLVIDGGRLGGTASTVIDLRRYESDGEWEIVRPGAVSEAVVEHALAGQFHFDPARYAAEIRVDIPVYDAFQDAAVAASRDRSPVRRILELGTGTGETALRLLAAHPGAELVGVDTSAAMLAMARERLTAAGVAAAGSAGVAAAGSAGGAAAGSAGVAAADLRIGRLQDPLPEGPFDLVASALCVHHLDGAAKRDLFGRVRAALRSGGRFVLADVVIPEDPSLATTNLTEGYDQPSTAADQLAWLGEAGFTEPRVAWTSGDLAVLVADVP